MFTGDLGFLSNFHQESFYFPPLSTRVASGEHAYNALKTADVVSQHRVLAASTPGKAKDAGRRVPLRSNWDAGAKVMAMMTVLRWKFARTEAGELSRISGLLIDTGDMQLVETNTWHDNFWGDCTCGGDGCAAPGKNMLGELLMARRASLRGNLWLG